MKRLSSICLITLTLISVLIYPLNGLAEESAKGTSIDSTLPIHQQRKLHPELADPVLGDQAAIVEWAWSPQYAERFGLAVQQDGLPNGGLWLIGVRIERKQFQRWQSYACHVVGLMSNKLPILTPPGEQHGVHPDYGWLGGLPGKQNMKWGTGPKWFEPGFQTWYKKPANRRQTDHPHSTDPLAKYILFFRNYAPELAYFDIEVGCLSFRDPELFRAEIRFPTRIDGKDDEDKTIGAVYERSAIRFDIPEGVMQRIYPYTADATDWSSCFLRRAGDKPPYLLSLRAMKSKRFGNICEPIVKQQ